MGFFENIKKAFRRGPEIQSLGLQTQEQQGQKQETKVESPEVMLQEGVQEAQNTHERINSRFQEAWLPKETEPAKEPEGKSLFQKVKGWVSRQIEAAATSIDQGVEASEVLDAMDFAKKVGLDLSKRVDLADPAVQQVLAGLKGYQGLTVGELVAGISIISEVRGYKNKLEAVKQLKDLQEQAKSGANVQNEFRDNLQQIDKDSTQLVYTVAKNRDQEELASVREQINQ